MMGPGGRLNLFRDAWPPRRIRPNRPSRIRRKSAKSYFQARNLGSVKRESDPSNLGLPEAARLLGISYRTLDRWCRMGLIAGCEGQGTGTRRQLGEEQMLRAREIKGAIDRAVRELERAGLPTMVRSLLGPRRDRLSTVQRRPEG